MKLDLDALAKLCEAYPNLGEFESITVTYRNGYVCKNLTRTEWEPILAARTALPALLARLKAAEAYIDLSDLRYSFKKCRSVDNHGTFGSCDCNAPAERTAYHTWKRLHASEADREQV